MARPRAFDRGAALRKAMLAFWERGYEETSIADLTATMGIAAPSLYAAFGDKRSLFDEAVALYTASEGAPIAQALGHPTAREAVEAVLQTAAVEYTRSGQPRGCFVIAEPLLEIQRRGSRAALAERLRAGVEARELSADTDVESLASYFAVVMAGMSSQARDGASTGELRAVADQALAAWPAGA